MADKHKFDVTYNQLIAYQQSSMKVRGNPKEPYTNKVQVAIDRNIAEINRLSEQIDTDIMDNRIEHAAIDPVTKVIIEKEQGVDRAGNRIINFQFTVEGKKALQKRVLQIEEKQREGHFYHAPEDTEWEAMMNIADYENLRGFLFPEDRVYDEDIAIQRGIDWKKAGDPMNGPERPVRQIVQPIQ